MPATQEQKEQIAEQAYAMVQFASNIIGGGALPNWADLGKFEQTEYVDTVTFYEANQDNSPELRHVAWLAIKQADGWVYGTTLDVSGKVHPLLRNWIYIGFVDKTLAGTFRDMVIPLLLALPPA